MRAKFLVLTLLMAAARMNAQTDAEIAVNLVFNQNQLRLNLADLSLDSPILTPILALQFEGAGEARSATALGGWFHCGNLTPEKCLANDPLGVHGKLSTPVAAKAKTARLVNRRGFEGETSLEVALKWSNVAQKINEAVSRHDLDGAMLTSLTTRVEQLPALRSQLLNVIARDDDALGTAIAELRTTNAAAERERSAALLMTSLTTIAALGTTNAARSELVDTIARSIRTADLPAGSRIRGRWATPYYASVVFTAARPTFEYANIEFVDQEEKHPVYAGSVFYGVTPLKGLNRDARYYIGVSHTYKVDYEEQDSSNICTPLDSATTLRCRDIAIGAPDRQLKHISEVEYRRSFRHVGVNPKVNYDWKSGTWGFELPLFIRQDVNGNFGGGIKAGWDTNKREFGAVVFISAFPGVKLPHE